MKENTNKMQEITRQEHREERERRGYIERIAALLEGAGERELRLVYLYVYHLICG